MLIVQLCPTLCDPMDCSPQAPLSMRFSRQGYWSGSPFPSPGDLPNPGIEAGCPALQADTLLTELQGKPGIQMTALKTERLIQDTRPSSLVVTNDFLTPVFYF